MVDERFDALLDAVEDDDVGRAIELFDDVNEAIEGLEGRDQTFRTLARSVTSTVDPSTNASKRAVQYVETASKAEMKRLNFMYEYLAYGEGERSAAAFASDVEELIEAESDVLEQQEKLANETPPAPIPPTIGLTGPKSLEFCAGSPVDFVYTVENAGPKSAKAIAVEVATDEGAVQNLSVEPDEFEELEPNDARSITITGDLDGTESDVIRVNIESADAVASRNVGVDVVDKLTLLKRAQREFDELTAQTEAKLDDNAPPFLERLQKARERLDDVVEEIENGSPPGRRPEGRINLTINQLETYRKQIANVLEEDELTAERAASLRSTAAGLIETIESAIDAEQ